MRRAGRRQMQIWVSGMPSFDTPRLQLFFDVAFEKAVSGLAIECNRTNSRMIGQQAYDLIRLLPADIAVETPFAFTAPADVPQCDSRAQQHRLAQPVLLRQRFPGQCRDQTPEGIARMAVILLFLQRHHSRHRSQNQHPATAIRHRIKTLQHIGSIVKFDPESGSLPLTCRRHTHAVAILSIAVGNHRPKP